MTCMFFKVGLLQLPDVPLQQHLTLVVTLLVAVFLHMQFALDHLQSILT